MDIASLLNNDPASPHCTSDESDKSWFQTKPQSAGKTWSLDEATLAHELKAQGKSWDDISRALPGRSAHACSEYDRRNNPLDHKKRWSPEDITLLDIMVGNRTPWTEISEKLGRGIAACRIRYKRLSRARDLAREKENWVRYNISHLEDISLTRILGRIYPSEYAIIDARAKPLSGPGGCTKRE
jgi:hypothetical protein